MEKIHIKGTIVDLVRSILFTIIFSLIFTLMLSTIIHYTSMSDTLISGLNIAFRGISILLGLILGIKHREKGLIKGLIVAIIYILITFIISCTIVGKVELNKMRLIDSLSNLIFGLISGIIAVNIHLEK